MVFCALLFFICLIVGIVVGVVVDTIENPHPTLLLTFFLDIVMGFGSMICFIVGHFLGA
jgi:hypothetical protein